MSDAVAQPESTGIPTPQQLGFDPAELRQRYEMERNKRIRRDGNEQYQEMVGENEHYNDDPYVEPGFTRPAIEEELDAVIIGGGFGGLLAAAHLHSTPPDPRRFAPQLPSRMVRLLARMLAKQPKRRPNAVQLIAWLADLEIETFGERFAG